VIFAFGGFVLPFVRAKDESAKGRVACRKKGEQTKSSKQAKAIFPIFS